MKALDSLYEAQKIAFSPFVFQTVYTMLELGIMDELYEERDGLTVTEIASRKNMTEYGVRVLVEMAKCADILELNDDKYSLSKIGYFLTRDEMTKVNLMFTQDICYKGLFHLKDAIVHGKPEGLKEIGPWETIYQGLSILPEQLRKSWFEFDHHYSDNSFGEALKIIFQHNPKHIYDIGGNTGKWAIASTKHDPSVRVSIFDLGVQLKVAKANIDAIAEIKDRVDFNERDMLNPASEIPAGADVYWMSQFLDCFSEGEIEAILLKIKKNMKPDATIFIMETFIDDQRFKAAEYSLVATSLYFTAIANGNSKMYSSSALKYIIEKAGLETVKEHRLHEDRFHTILEVKLPK
ncbi:methyltransferase [Fluviicola taffensis]|uniref:O-methyltransferase family 2 n=1 Tax=Fluviicola taffensis (strain DSM 16823 / NCIMB 13979 / RW262) TaxID=755732 RepID=F2IDQ0_FLUTR|nr:methyltransferase [Fluviicola taffensis]AEA43423.1 O-methyltransferase family 2 [Fluviicola taffensis DSM 16823]